MTRAGLLPREKTENFTFLITEQELDLLINEAIGIVKDEPALLKLCGTFTVVRCSAA